MGTFIMSLSNTEWTRITVAGESGTCWKKTGTDILVACTDQESADNLPLSNTNVTIEKSKRVPLDVDSNEVLVLPALDGNYVFYALVVGSDSGKIVVDSLRKIEFSFKPDDDWFDTISLQDIIVELAAGRFNDVSGLEIGLNEKNTDPDGSLNLGPDAYAQILKKSEDMTDGVWLKSTGVVVTSTTFKADSAFDALTQVLNTTDSISYTFSFMASVEVGGNLDDYRIKHTNSASGNSTDISLTTSPKRYDVTVLGRAGGGNVDFGFIDTNTSDWATVTITDFQVTASTYRLPYAPNLSAVSTLLVPSNNSGPASGYSYEIKEDLRNSLDGVADGVEEVTNGGFDTDSDWNKGDSTTISGGLANLNGLLSNFQLIQAGVLTASTYYEVTYTITSFTSGGIRVKLGATNGINRSSTGTFTERIIASNVNLVFQATGSGVVCSIDNVSVKQISDAKGELVKTIIPMFNAGDIGAIVNIATANDEETSFFLYDDINELLTAFDGTNTATVAFSPVNGTEYEIRLMYGDNSGQKMKVAVDQVWGVAVTNVGSFPNDTELKFGYGSEWFKIKTDPGPVWYKEPQSSW